MFDRYQRRRLAGAWPVAAVLLVPPGVAAEYLTAYIEETDEFGTLDTTTTFLIPSLEAGYRFLLGPVLLGGGGALGYAFGLTSECAYTAGTCTSDPIDNTVYAEAVVDVGLRF